MLVVVSWIEVESKPAPLTPKGAAPNYREQPKTDAQKSSVGHAQKIRQTEELEDSRCATGWPI